MTPEASAAAPMVRAAQTDSAVSRDIIRSATFSTTLPPAIPADYERALATLSWNACAPDATHAGQPVIMNFTPIST